MSSEIEAPGSVITVADAFAVAVDCAATEQGCRQIMATIIIAALNIENIAWNFWLRNYVFQWMMKRKDLVLIKPKMN